MTTAVLAASSPVSDLSAGLESVGWQILALDVDLSRETARVEVRRADGLNVTFDARNGRASLTREMIETETVRVGRRGDVTRVERIRPRFVGRVSGLGVRQGLRALCDYLSDNAVRALPPGDVRNLFRPLMDGAAHTR
jgi:hypothetical protein